MPRVYNKSTNKNIPVDAVFVGRPSEFGNPFIVGIHGVRGECCDLFDDLVDNDPLFEQRIIDELEGKDLVCFCAPRRCHADRLLRTANGIKKKEPKKSVNLNSFFEE